MRGLESLRVVGQTEVMAGPLCTMLLADGHFTVGTADDNLRPHFAGVLEFDRHTEAVLGELGYGSAEISQLREKGVPAP
jgi:crotonobetainyl-CoA:carnitine CoA-transferase CaiB-like acyl-CoA transferase